MGRQRGWSGSNATLQVLPFYSTRSVPLAEEVWTNVDKLCTWAASLLKTAATAWTSLARLNFRSMCARRCRESMGLLQTMFLFPIPSH